MKKSLFPFVLAAALWWPAVASAQGFNLDWYKISDGGGTSAGGVYGISGTIGQADASPTMSGGSYALTGGFWSMIQTLPTPDLPPLTIVRSGKQVAVAWPNTGSYILQQNSNLGVPGGWITSGYPVTTANGTNSITVTSPGGNLFFRLSQP